MLWASMGRPMDCGSSWTVRQAHQVARNGGMEDPGSIGAYLDEARRLMAQPRLDIFEALIMLNGVALTLGPDAAIDRAREAISHLASGDGRNLTIARYALGRVIVVLKRQVDATG